MKIFIRMIKQFYFLWTMKFMSVGYSGSLGVRRSCHSTYQKFRASFKKITYGCLHLGISSLGFSVAPTTYSPSQEPTAIDMSVVERPSLTHFWRFVELGWNYK
jgi:hypothetical protein